MYWGHFLKTAVKSFFLGVLVTLGVLIAAVIYDRHPSVYGVIERDAKTAWTKVFGPSRNPESFTICEIPSLSQVPKGSVIIIGHARSDLDETDDFPGPKVSKLLTENRDKISHVVFTGDIFAVPSRRRWQNLKRYFAEIGIDVLIAPGNHEHLSGENASRDIFQEQIGEMHLRTVVLPEAVMIVEDSTRSNWLFSEDAVDLVAQLNEEYPTRKLIIVRHNIPVMEMLSLANSRIDMASGLPSAADVALRFQNESVVVVSGDSGAFRHLPRSSCHKHHNLMFLSNGLGGFDEDEILILDHGKIWKYLL
jgi:hypothetical protein